jgi:hypothetical protein
MATKKSFKVSKSGLIADQELFRIWFGFYQLALVSEDPEIKSAMKKSQKFYADWGTDANVHFDDWWESHRQLFEDTSVVRMIGSCENMDEHHLYLAVPKTRSINVAIDEIRELLAEHFKVTRSKRTQVPMHRYAPTEVQGFKRETARLHLDMMREVFNDSTLRGKALYARVKEYFEHERFKKKKNVLPSPFASLDINDEGAKRNVLRYRKRCEQLLMNVAGGVFPGVY